LRVPRRSGCLPLQGRPGWPGVAAAYSCPGSSTPSANRYTRAEALPDGVLIDGSETAREAGIRWPVALTRAAWGRRAAAHGRAAELCRLGQAARLRPLGLPEARLDGTAGPPTQNRSERSAAGQAGPFAGRSDGRPRLTPPLPTRLDPTPEANPIPYRAAG